MLAVPGLHPNRVGDQVFDVFGTGGNAVTQHVGLDRCRPHGHDGLAVNRCVPGDIDQHIIFVVIDLLAADFWARRRDVAEMIKRAPVQPIKVCVSRPNGIPEHFKLLAIQALNDAFQQHREAVEEGIRQRPSQPNPAALARAPLAQALIKLKRRAFS